MGSETVLLPLSSIVRDDSPITYGVVKPGEEDPNGVPFIRSGDLTDGVIDPSSLRTITDSVSRQYRRTLLEGGEILVSLVGTPGQAAIVPSSLAGANIARQVALVRVASSHSTRYVYYCLASKQGRESLLAHSRGSVQQVINLGDLQTVEIPVPPLPDQKAIAHILGSLDDKIELNRKTNETLEAIARALFKSWFVDFDPVRAKAQGRPTGLPDAISGLFPDSFEDSALGEIPVGWTTGWIRDLIAKAGMGPFGSRMKTDTFQKQGVPIIKGGNLKGMYVEGYGPDFLSHEHAVELESSCVRAGDIVLTHRGTLGQVSMVPFGGQVEKYVVSQSQFYLRPVSVSAGSYLLFFLHSSVGVSRLLANASGVGVPSLARPSTLTPQIELPIPSAPLLDFFAFQAIGVQKSFMARLEEQSSLCSIRDTLLPKLISGELRIPEAERLLEEAGV